MYRVLTTLPPNTKPMPTERIERIHDDAKKATMEKKGCQSKSAIAYAHKDLISNPEYGMTLTNIMERSGFKTAYTLRCDKCTDEDECCFYIPEIAYGLKAKIACAACWGKSKAICSFNGIANTPDLVDAIRSFGAFRRHVPCNQCYVDQHECDNRAGSCGRCETQGEECVRELCTYADQPGDDSNCPKDCDKAHEDDGYTNARAVPRGAGCNVRLRLQKQAQACKD